MEHLNKLAFEKRKVFLCIFTIFRIIKGKSGLTVFYVNFFSVRTNVTAYANFSIHFINSFL